MLVRIHWSNPQKNYAARLQDIALGISSLLIPSALIAFTLAIWSIAANLRWTTDFIIGNGVFSHWQSWFVTAAISVLFAKLLNRYGTRLKESGYRDTKSIYRFP